jgi:hypothetical protein
LAPVDGVSSDSHRPAHDHDENAGMEDSGPARNPPSQTVYANNLDEHYKEKELREFLQSLFAPFGKVSPCFPLFFFSSFFSSRPQKP